MIHQDIYIPGLDHHLLSLMQCRVADVEINDCPRFLIANPTCSQESEMEVFQVRVHILGR